MVTPVAAALVHESSDRQKTRSMLVRALVAREVLLTTLRTSGSTCVRADLAVVTVTVVFTRNTTKEKEVGREAGFLPAGALAEGGWRREGLGRLEPAAPGAAATAGAEAPEVVGRLPDRPCFPGGLEAGELAEGGDWRLRPERAGRTCSVLDVELALERLETVLHGRCCSGGVESRASRMQGDATGSGGKSVSSRFSKEFVCANAESAAIRTAGWGVKVTCTIDAT